MMPASEHTVLSDLCGEGKASAAALATAELDALDWTVPRADWTPPGTRQGLVERHDRHHEQAQAVVAHEINGVQSELARIDAKASLLLAFAGAGATALTAITPAALTLSTVGYWAAAAGLAAAAILQPLSAFELRALTVVLSSLRKPRRIRPDDGIVDAVAVERAAAGELVSLTKTERRAAAARIVAEGHGPGQIAERLGVSAATARALHADVCRPDAATARSA